MRLAESLCKVFFPAFSTWFAVTALTKVGICLVSISVASLWMARIWSGSEAGASLKVQQTTSENKERAKRGSVRVQKKQKFLSNPVVLARLWFRQCEQYCRNQRLCVADTQLAQACPFCAARLPPLPLPPIRPAASHPLAADTKQQVSAA